MAALRDQLSTLANSLKACDKGEQGTLSNGRIPSGHAQLVDFDNLQHDSHFRLSDTKVHIEEPVAPMVHAREPVRAIFGALTRRSLRGSYPRRHDPSHRYSGLKRLPGMVWNDPQPANQRPSRPLQEPDLQCLLSRLDLGAEAFRPVSARQLRPGTGHPRFGRLQVRHRVGLVPGAVGPHR